MAAMTSMETPINVRVWFVFKVLKNDHIKFQSPFVSPNTKKNVDGVVSDMVQQIGQANGDASVEQPNLDDSVGLSVCFSLILCENLGYVKVSNGSMTEPGLATLPDESAHEPSPPPQPIVDAGACFLLTN